MTGTVERLYCKRPIQCRASSKYWPPTARRVSNPRLWCRGRTHSLGGEGDGGSIFWKTPDTALYSTYVSTLLLGLSIFLCWTGPEGPTCDPVQVCGGAHRHLWGEVRAQLQDPHRLHRLPLQQLCSRGDGGIPGYILSIKFDLSLIFCKIAKIIVYESKYFWRKKYFVVLKIHKNSPNNWRTANVVTCIDLSARDTCFWKIKTKTYVPLRILSYNWLCQMQLVKLWHRNIDGKKHIRSWPLL